MSETDPVEYTKHVHAGNPAVMALMAEVERARERRLPDEVAFSDVRAAIAAADDAERDRAAALFAEWAQHDDILSRFSSEQHAEVARVFVAGYLSALTGEFWKVRSGKSSSA